MNTQMRPLQGDVGPSSTKHHHIRSNRTNKLTTNNPWKLPTMDHPHTAKETKTQLCWCFQFHVTFAFSLPQSSSSTSSLVKILTKSLRQEGVDDPSPSGFHGHNEVFPNEVFGHGFMPLDLVKDLVIPLSSNSSSFF